nr:MAG TPA: hypothetical protein [Caudoviricetes sp.]
MLCNVIAKIAKKTYKCLCFKVSVFYLVIFTIYFSFMNFSRYKCLYINVLWFYTNHCCMKFARFDIFAAILW